MKLCGLFQVIVLGYPCWELEEGHVRPVSNIVLLLWLDSSTIAGLQINFLS